MMKDIDDRRRRLSIAKRAVLEKRLRGEWAGAAGIFRRRVDQGRAPLCCAQQPASVQESRGLSSGQDGTGRQVDMETLVDQSSAGFLQIEKRSLLWLHATGKLAPVNSAALTYLPFSIIEQTGLSRDEIIHSLCGELPVFYEVMESFLGRTAFIVLPVFGSELYLDKEHFVRVVVEALEMASQLGARTVSLTGLIPSATDYGRDIASAIAGRKDLPAITTGHATTAAAVVLAIKRVVEEGGRDLSQERVGFLGLGSIGGACLRLMLRCLPHPLEIILCDVYNKGGLLNKIREEIVSGLGFKGSVRATESLAEVPSGFYDSTLIIGATNAPEVLDVGRLKSGTMIVDDSGPHCFSPEQAIRRFREQRDILFTAGGVLRSPEPTRTLFHVPELVVQFVDVARVKLFSRHNPFNVTGCVLSSSLSSRYEDIQPTVGLVDVNACFGHYEILGRLGFQAADLHCESYVLEEPFIRSFRSSFGGCNNPGNLGASADRSKMGG